MPERAPDSGLQGLPSRRKKPVDRQTPPTIVRRPPRRSVFPPVGKGLSYAIFPAGKLWVTSKAAPQPYRGPSYPVLPQPNQVARSLPGSLPPESQVGLARPSRWREASGARVSFGCGTQMVRARLTETHVVT